MFNIKLYIELKHFLMCLITNLGHLVSDGADCFSCIYYDYQA